MCQNLLVKTGFLFSEESEKLLRPDFPATRGELGSSGERQNAEFAKLSLLRLAYGQPFRAWPPHQNQGIPDDGYGDGIVVKHEEAAET